MFIDHPLGVGVKNFEKLVPHYDFRNKGLDAHNTYILCYSEIGIFGIVLFIVIIIEALFQLKRVSRMVRGTPYEQEITIEALSLNTAMIVYLFGQMVTHSILYREFFWILLAMPICLENATCKLLDSSSNR